MEIPLDWNNQVAILFIIPEDDNYYCLYAGHWNNNTESMQLVISGTVHRNGDKLDFDFFDEEKEIVLDYFKIKQKQQFQTLEIYDIIITNLKGDDGMYYLAACDDDVDVLDICGRIIQFLKTQMKKQINLCVSKRKLKQAKR